MFLVEPPPPPSPAAAAAEIMMISDHLESFVAESQSESLSVSISESPGVSRQIVAREEAPCLHLFTVECLNELALQYHHHVEQEKTDVQVISSRRPIPWTGLELLVMCGSLRDIIFNQDSLFFISDPGPPS